MTKTIVADYKLPVNRACQIMKLPRSQYYYNSRKDDTGVAEALQELAFAHPSYGFRKIFAYLRKSGKSWNHKKVYRVYKLLKLNKKRKGKRRLPTRLKQPLLQQTSINKTWSMDFMSDSMINSRRFRTLNIIDDCSREALAIEIDSSLSSPRVTRTLNQLLVSRGKPSTIRVDNGSEFTSVEFVSWCKTQNICIQYTQPGKPMQNGFIERFNRIYREAILDAYLFYELDEVRALTEEWLNEYNYKRPHESLGNCTPNEYKNLLTKKEKLNFENV